MPTDNYKICAHCKNPFEKNPRISKKQWDKAMCCSKRCSALLNGKNINHDEIVSLYKAGMSSSEIGRKLNISGKHVLHILKTCGIETRNASENKKLACNKTETREKMSRSATGRKLSESAKQKLRLLTGPLSPSWKGGLTIQNGGYLVFTRSRANGDESGKLIHRKIAEEMIGRPLLPEEVVHHADGNKLNNAPENLIIMSQSEHLSLHNRERSKRNAESM